MYVYIYITTYISTYCIYIYIYLYIYVYIYPYIYIYISIYYRVGFFHTFHFFVVSKRSLQETCNSYFCITPKKQALHDSSSVFFQVA